MQKSNHHQRPADFFQFPKLKRSLKAHHLDNVPAIQQAVTVFLKEVTALDFQGALAEWESHWKRCIDAQGNRFEEFSYYVPIGSRNSFYQTQSHYFTDRHCV